MDVGFVPMYRGMRPTRPLARLRLARPGVRGGALLLSVTLLLALSAGPAGAAPVPANPTSTAPTPPPMNTPALLKTLADAPTDSPASPDDPFQAVVDADKVVVDKALARITATTDSAMAADESAQAAKARDAAFAKDLIAQKVQIDATHKLSMERRRMSKLTVRAYVTGGDPGVEQYRALLAGDTSDQASGQAILFGQVLERQRQVTDRARHDLATAVRRRNATDAKLDAAKHDAADRASHAADLASQMADAVSQHQAALAGAASARSKLAAAASRPVTLVPLGEPLVGVPRLTADDLAGWFATSPYHPRVSTPITDYAQWFIEEGQAEGIRGDIAFAQAVLETGGFANDDSVTANNFSGIGHCDLCGSGWAFPTPELGVRAQIQLLKSYAIKKPDYASPLVDKRLRGPAGCCPTWGDLTTVWATDPGYGPKVMLIYTAMVDYALQRRAAGQGLESTAPSTP